MTTAVEGFERKDYGEFFAFLLPVNIDQSFHYLTTLFNCRVYMALEYDHEGMLVRTVKATVATHTKVLSQHMPGETDENHEKP
jgi:hypothetical protein